MVPVIFGHSIFVLKTDFEKRMVIPFSFYTPKPEKWSVFFLSNQKISIIVKFLTMDLLEKGFMC